MTFRFGVLMALSSICKVSAGLMHLYTTYLAFQAWGVIPAVIAFFLPGLAELVMFGAAWKFAGALINSYTLACLFVVGMYGLTALIVSSFDKTKSDAQSA